MRSRNLTSSELEVIGETLEPCGLAHGDVAVGLWVSKTAPSKAVALGRNGP